MAQLPLPANGVITQPGVYYLQQDLLLTRDTGISIQANNVVLDLRGFDIRYIGAPHSGTFGIVAMGRSNVRITNGTIGGYWFNIHTSQNHGLQVDHMIFDDIPYIGINAATSYNVWIEDNTFSNFRYDIPKPTDAYLIGVNIGAEDAVVSRNHFDAVYSGSTPNAPGVETVCVLFSADVSKRSVVSNNQMAANIPIDRSYGLWIASNAHVTAMHNTIENLRYGVTLASNGVGLAGYNDFSVDPPPDGVPALPSTFGVFAVSAEQVFTTGNTFQGQTHPTYLPPNPTGDWNNTNMVLALTINNLGESLLPGVGYDAVEFPGTFTHGGLVSIDLSAFAAGPVGEVKVVGWTSESGNRGSTRMSFSGGVPVGYDFRSDGLYVTLTHTLLGDFNGDHEVNGADYVVWRAEYGTPALYDTWRAHYGETATQDAEARDYRTFSSSVAEPAVGPMCFLLAIVVTLRRRARAALNCNRHDFNYKVLLVLIALLAVLTAQTGFAERASSDAHTLSSNALGEVESRSVVFDYGNYDPYDRANLYGFNHAPSVTRISGNRLHAAWFSGPYEGSIHQVILGAGSEDGGRTWGEAKILNDAPRLSDFDPAFIDAGDRTLLFFSTGRWTRWPPVDRRKSRNEQVGGRSFKINMRQRSKVSDAWSDAVSIASDAGWNCRSNGFRMSTKELLLPTHRLEPQPFISSVLISNDEGQTWMRGPDIKTPGAIGAAEPSVAELPDGTLVMSLRATDGRLWLSRSHDHGRTWSEPERTKLVAAASSSNLFCTSRGRFLLTYSSSAPERTQLSLRESKDAGKSWTDLLVLAAIKPASPEEEVYSRQVCYPSVCELADGRLRVVWAKIEESARMQLGVIESALVRLHDN